MSASLDDLEAVARAALDPSPDEFSARLMGEWVRKGRAFERTFDPPTVLALIARLREAEATINAVEDFMTSHYLDTVAGGRVLAIIADYTPEAAERARR